ncbi:MAG: phosphoglycerate mutase family protein [Runella sp.]
MKNGLYLVLLFVFSSCYTHKIYVVRHAERLDKSEDSPLSAQGFARANALKDTLQNVRIDSVFVTQYLRTRQTAELTFQAKNLSPAPYPAHPTSVIVARLQRLKNKNALVVGHSDTVLEIVKGLGVSPQKVTKIGSNDYDNLFVIEVVKKFTKTQKTLTEKKYGAVSH